MAKRVTTIPPKEPTNGKRARARAALDSVLDSIHEDNRVLEGDELVEAIYKVFGLVRPHATTKESK